MGKTLPPGVMSVVEILLGDRLIPSPPSTVGDCVGDAIQGARTVQPWSEYSEPGSNELQYVDLGHSLHSYITDPIDTTSNSTYSMELSNAFGHLSRFPAWEGELLDSKMISSWNELLLEFEAVKVDVGTDVVEPVVFINGLGAFEDWEGVVTTDGLLAGELLGRFDDLDGGFGVTCVPLIVMDSIMRSLRYSFDFESLLASSIANFDRVACVAIAASFTLL